MHLKKCFEIVNIVESSSDLDILEETHPEDSKDEHYEEEKKTNVEKSRKGHHQREEQSPDTLGSFDQPQNSPHLGNPGIVIGYKYIRLGRRRSYTRLVIVSVLWRDVEIFI